jgi:hypothetical protein
LNLSFVDHLQKFYAGKQGCPFWILRERNGHELSDIDIFFFVDSLNGEHRADIITEMLGIAGKYKAVFFEPIVFPVSEIERGNPFVREILTTGTGL